MKGIIHFNSKKLNQQNDLPTKIVKENKDVAGFFLQHNFNKLFSASAFLQANIYVDVTTVQKNR